MHGVVLGNTMQHPKVCSLNNFGGDTIEIPYKIDDFRAL